MTCRSSSLVFPSFFRGPVETGSPGVGEPDLFLLWALLLHFQVRVLRAPIVCSRSLSLLRHTCPFYRGRSGRPWQGARRTARVLRLQWAPLRVQSPSLTQCSLEISGHRAFQEDLSFGHGGPEVGRSLSKAGGPFRKKGETPHEALSVTCILLKNLDNICMCISVTRVIEE